MKNKSEKHFSCKNCMRYHAFYRKGYVCFWEEMQGVCQKWKEIVSENDRCDFFKPPCSFIFVSAKAVESAIKNVYELLKLYDKQDIQGTNPE